MFSAEFALTMGTLSVVSFVGGTLVDAGLPVRTLALCVGVLSLAPALLWLVAQRLWEQNRSDRQAGD